MNRNSVVCLGDEITLQHRETEARLRSIGKYFRHPKSSGQQMVVASPEADRNAHWRVKSAHGATETLVGRRVKDGDIIRLVHVVTGTNLHSHTHPAPINRDQQEVTAFGSQGRGDENDDWIVHVPAKVWKIGERVEFEHLKTKRRLHSHGARDPQLTDGYQEVTCYSGLDGNNDWIAQRVGAEGGTEPVENFPRAKFASHVLDASVLLFDPSAIFRYEEDNVVIPQSAVNEANRMVNAGGERARTAQKLLRVLNELLPDSRAMREGTHLPNGGMLAVVDARVGGNSADSPAKIQLRTLSADLDEADKGTLGAALFAQETFPPPVVLVSRDVKLLLHARSLGLEAVEYTFDPVPDLDPGRIAGYSSEFCGLGQSAAPNDSLNVERYARQMADLIAARETQLPLALGVFADWGSGKSYFMNLIDRRMAQVAAHERNLRAKGSRGGSCAEIVSVHFNAWHYIDTNLWASLVTEIFDQLFQHLNASDQKNQKTQQLIAELERARGAVAEAEASRTRAEEAKERAKKAEGDAIADATKAAEEKKGYETFIATTLDSIDELFKKKEFQEKWTEAVQVLHIDEASKSLSKLERRVDEFRTLGGQARATWDAITSEGMFVRFAGLALAALVLPQLAGALGWILSFWQENLRQVGSAVGQISGLVLGCAGWLGHQAQRGRSFIQKIEELEQRAKALKEERKNTPEIQQAREKARECAQREAEAKLRIEEAKIRVAQIEQELREWQPDRRLFKFIEDRAKGESYRVHLGLVSLVRRDFHELSRLFAEKSATGDGTNLPDAQLTRSVDRIVLFIDDLDRCSSEKIVDVLQAVHLLLAFPLFAVVVGVDQRCLRRSIEQQFQELVETETGNGGGAATALDYLEKIFHIPFQLPLMTETGFAQLIEDLGNRSAEEEPTKESTATEAGLPRRIAEDASAELAPLTFETGIKDGGRDIVQRSEPTYQLRASSPLQRWEIDCLKSFHALIRTPRAATRLLNTYRLVRAGLPAESWNEFSDRGPQGGACVFVMLLLACAAGSPAGSRLLFQTVRKCDYTKFMNRTDKERSNLEDAFRKQLAAFLPTAGAERLWRQRTDWLDRIERYTF